LLFGQVQLGFKIGEVGRFPRVALGAKVLMPCAWVFALVLHCIFSKDKRRAQKRNGQKSRDPLLYHELSPIVFLDSLILGIKGNGLRERDKRPGVRLARRLAKRRHEQKCLIVSNRAWL
jgi:hypothetical protein